MKITHRKNCSISHWATLLLAGWLAIAVVLSVSSPCVAGQRIPPGPRYIFQPIGMDEGRDTITPHSVIQDSNGFLWVASQSGLFRYDGSKLFLFTQALGIPETNIQQVIEAPNGVIWATASDDVFHFDGLRFAALNTGLKGIITAGKLAFGQRLTFDASGNLYIATEKGVVRFTDADPARKKTWSVKEGIPTGAVTAIKTASDGSILFAVQDRVGKIDPESGKVTVLSNLGVTPREKIFSIATTSDGKISVRTLSHLMWFDAGSGRFVPDEEGLPQDSNEAGHIIDSRDQIWAGTSNGLFFKENGRWTSASTKNGLPSDSIRTVTEDHEGALWIGLSGFGLVRWPGPTTWKGWTTEEGLGNNHIWCITRDKYDRLLLGMNHGLNIWDPATEKWSHFTKKNGLIGDQVRRLRTDADGRVWAMTRNAGFTVIDPDTLALTPVPVPERFNKSPIDMNGGPDGKMWVTGDGYLYTVRLDNGSPVFADVPISSDFLGCITTVGIASNGVAWTGGAKGLCRYDGSKWRRFDHASNGLHQDSVEDVVVLSDKEVWINYRDSSLGISKLTLDEDGSTSIDHVKVEDGILEGAVFMVERGADDIWIGGAVGVSIVSPDYSVKTASHHDGLLWDDIDRGGLYTEKDGTIWVGTSGGLAYYTPKGADIEDKPPRVVIVSANLGGEEVLGQEKATADSDHDTFVAKFSGLTFRDTHKVQFKYRLVGLESEFIPTDLRTVRYPTLSSGKYTFEVLCRSTKGIWSKAPATFTFEVLPPWWMQWWLLSLAMIVVVGVVVGFYRYKVQRMRARDREVSLLAWEKTKAALSSQINALKKMVDETSMITHDMGSMSSKMASITTGLEASVSGASAAIEELGRTGSQSENNAKSIVDAASQTITFAKKGQDAVAESKVIMEDVEKDASQIVDKSTRMFNRLEEVDIILTMVNSIADQSRVLAINASIEAASAGEFGAGFGVVAREMGSLAEQIKDLTLKVSELLTSSHVSIKEIVKSAQKTQGKMGDGVRSVDHSGDIVSELSEALTKNTELAKIIKVAIGEQHMGLSLISSEIQKVYVTSSDSTALSSRVAEQAQQLNSFIEQLDEMIENWKTPDLLL